MIWQDRTILGIVAAGGVALAVIVATGTVYAGSGDGLALVIIAAMAAAASVGLVELVRCARAVRELEAGLAALPRPAATGDVERADPRLQAMLRARLQGAPRPVRGAELTPYLVGVLVMLGLLGTFLGLFDAMRGARAVVGGSRDATALHDALATPLSGLTRSFGTSAAGLCASAMLGLAAVLLRRRERMLDAALSDFVAGPLAGLSPARRHEELLARAVEQGAAMPEAAAALRDVVAELRGLGTSWSEQHSSSAEQVTRSFERGLQTSGEALARAVDGLRDGLRGESERAAAAVRDTVTPLLSKAVEGTVEAAAAQVRALREAMERDATARRADDTARFAELTERVSSLLARMEQTEDARRAADEAVSEAATERAAALFERLDGDVERRRAQEAEHWEQLQARLAELQEVERERAAAVREERTAAVATLRGLLEQTVALDRERAEVARHEREVAVEAVRAVLREASERERERAEQLAAAAGLVERELQAATAAARESIEVGAQATREMLDAGRALVTEQVASGAAAAREQLAATAAAAREQAEQVAAMVREQLAETAAAARDQLAETSTAARDQLVSTVTAVREQLAGTATETREQLATAATAVRELLAEASSSAREQLAAAAAANRDQLAETATSARGQLTHAATAARDQLADAATAVREQLAAAAAAVREQLETAALAGGEQLESVTSAAREQVAALADAERERHARVAEIAGAVASYARLAGELAGKVDASIDRHRAEREELERRLAAMHEATLASSGDRMRAHVDELGACAADVVEGARQASAALAAGTGELAAVAEMLAASVDRHRDAANLWLESLGAVDAAVQEAGEGAAADALAHQLASTSELFAQQLEFHREVFEQIKSLRGTPAAAPANGNGADHVRA